MPETTGGTVPYKASPLILNKLAPHPYASMPLIDFLLDKDATSLLRDAGYFLARPDVTPSEAIASYDPKKQGFKKFLVDEPEMATIIPQLRRFLGASSHTIIGTPRAGEDPTFEDQK